MSYFPIVALRIAGTGINAEKMMLGRGVPGDFEQYRLAQNLLKIEMEEDKTEKIKADRSCWARA